MLLKGKVGAEEKIYRVLDLKEKVLVLDCVKKTMPVFHAMCGNGHVIISEQILWM